MVARILGWLLLAPTIALAWYSLVVTSDDLRSDAWYDEWAVGLAGTTPVRYAAGVLALLVGATAVDLIADNDWWWRRTDKRFR